ncbi:MAG: hypothetical protein JXN60_07980, partial [Lentisphaerae bacterium]|nr:hypothetical protein [Lentisphaerota bacterium]
MTWHCIVGPNDPIEQPFAGSGQTVAAKRTLRNTHEMLGFGAFICLVLGAVAFMKTPAPSLIQEIHARLLSDLAIVTGYSVKDVSASQEKIKCYSLDRQDL